MIREARREDLEAVLAIYAYARAFMARSGNPTQWGDYYPERELVEEDIARGRLYVMCGEDGVPHGVFALSLEEEPSYAHIREGAWPNDLPYGTIHRVAGDGSVHGLVKAALDFCLPLCPVIRADTHLNNKVMQRRLEACGFVRCGLVELDYYRGDTLRVAYQYTSHTAGERGET